MLISRDSVTNEIKVDLDHEELTFSRGIFKCQQTSNDYKM